MRLRWASLTFLLIAAGCQHDVRVRGLGPGGVYESAFLRAEGFALEDNGQRRLVLRESPVKTDEHTGDPSILMYVSFPTHGGHLFDLGDPQVFVVFSDVAAQFSGFVKPLSVEQKRRPGGSSLSGTFAGTLREGETGAARDVEITVNDAPVTPLESPEAIQRERYMEMLHKHVYHLEFGAPDYKDVSPQTENEASKNESPK